MNKVRLKYGSNALLVTVVLLAILILINVILAQKPIKWDLTKTGQYSLSSQTKQVLKDLKTDVKVYAFFRDGDGNKDRVKTLLDEYSNLSKHVKVTFVDPDKDPATAKKYGITDYGTTVFIAGSGASEKRQVVNSYDIFGISQSDPSQSTFNGEQEFTQAIINVTQQKKIKAYILQGHDELNSIDYMLAFKNALTGEGYDVNDLNMAQSGGIPKDAGLIVIANPKREFNQQEMKALKDYFSKGGKAIFMMGAENGALTQKSVNELLSQWGVKVDNDVVVDPGRNYFMNALSPVPEYKFHTITNKLDFANFAMVMPSSRSITYPEKSNGNVTVEPLLSTSDKAWGETNFAQKQASYDSKDIKGPLTLGVAVSNDKTGMKVVVLGNDLIATDNVIGLEANKDFLMNSANWMVDKTNQISIRAKSLGLTQIFLTGSQAKLIFYSTVVVIPLAMWILGGFIWFRRRAL
ncbi:GldG family protein [Caldanaerobius polysaccharolyticus]|uniref:GldG family protein n=1 Tax=Caldanaerobius polysaccharolyticus TaxID=44256 RepID=UPI00047B54D6|nr:GldG family protein [Caldanaerobius polysaccharolyticus]